MTGRPYVPGARVPKVQIRAPRIACHVFAPARHCHVPPAAVPRARGCHHDRVAPVRQHVRAWRRIARRGEAPQHRRHEVTHVCLARDLVPERPRDQHVAWHPLLQQQLGRLDDGLGMEAPDHRRIVQDIPDGHQRHRLVVRHVAVHDRHRRVFRESTPGEVERFAQPIWTARSGGRQADEIPDRRLGLDHRSQCRGVRGDHEVVAEAPLEAEARHAEARILVGALEVTRIEGRFRDPPRNAVCGRVRHLPRDDEAIGVAQQAEPRCAHDERGHQVLEHRSRPGDERGAAADGRQGATQPEPVGRVHLALGDGEEAGQASLGRQKVVAVGIEAPIPDSIADGEELARRYEEEEEVRLPEEPLRLLGDLPKGSHERHRGRRGSAGIEDVGSRRLHQCGQGRRSRITAGRLRRDGLEIPGVAGHGGLGGLRPGHQLASWSCGVIRHESPGDIGERAGLCR